MKHSELLECINPTNKQPLLERSSLNIARYVRWLVGVTDALCDQPPFKEQSDKRCRLCGSEYEETRSHLLTNCRATQPERKQYTAAIQKISKRKLLEYSTVPEHRRWIWTLGGGTIREPRPNPLSNNKILKASAGILTGRTVTPVKDKTDQILCMDAYDEYLSIISEFEPEHIRVYTDGSHSRTEERTGYGIRIIKYSRGREAVLLQESSGLGGATINDAELTAVHVALNWLLHKHKGPLVPIHIFTDSKYTFNASTSIISRRKNFHLTQEIQNLGYRIGDLNNMTRPLMHFVPSHIENTSQGKKRTGNYYADILATEGRKMSTHEDKSKYLETLRGTLLTATIQMLESIDNKLNIFRIPDGPSTHVDDLSAQHLCRPGSSQYEDPVT